MTIYQDQNSRKRPQQVSILMSLSIVRGIEDVEFNTIGISVGKW